MANTGAIRAGRAYVEVYADKSKLEASLKAASRDITTFGKSVSKLASYGLNAGLAIGAGLAVAVKKTVSMAENINLMSKRVGLGTREMTALGFAADHLGVNIEALEKGLRFMHRNLYGISVDSKSLAPTFKALGVSFSQMQTATTTQKLLILADAFEKIEDPSAKVGLAMRVFGGGGAAMIPMLAAGSAEIKRLTSYAEKLGITLDADSARAAFEFRDKLEAVGKVCNMLIYRIGEALIPDITKLANVVLDNAKATIDWVKSHKDLVVSLAQLAKWLIIVNGSVKLFGIAFGTSGIILKNSITVISSLSSVFIKLAKSITTSLIAINAAQVGLAALNAKAAGFSAIGVGAVTSGSGAAQMVRGMGVMMSGLMVKIAAFATSIPGIITLVAVAAVGLAAWAIHIARANSAMGKLKKSQEESNTAFNELKKLSAIQELDINQKLRAATLIEQLTKKYGDLGVSINKATGEITGMGEAQEKILLKNLQDELSVIDKDIEKAKARPKGLGGLDPSSIGNNDVVLLESKRAAIAKQIADIKSVQTEKENAMVRASTEEQTQARIDSAQKLHELQISQIEDEKARGLAEIDEKYDKEFQRLDELGADKETFNNTNIARAIEIAALEKKLDEERFEEQKKYQDEIKQIQLDAENGYRDARIAGIKDAYRREQAEITAKYNDKEKEILAKASPQDAPALVAANDKAREQELKNARENHQAEIGDMNKDMTGQIAELKIKLNPDLTKTEKELQLLGIEYQAALEEATKNGTDPALVTELYGLKAKEITEGAKEPKQQSKSFGTFSAFALGQLGGQSPVLAALEKIARGIEKVVNNTEDDGED